MVSGQVTPVAWADGVDRWRQPITTRRLAAPLVVWPLGP